MKEKNETHLVALKQGQLATILSIAACHKTVKRLADMGLTTNTQIKILRKAGIHGPIEIEVKGSNLILGKGIVSKILVKKI
jgi:DtxR family Mn-dependent transcriptional regulator